VRHVTDILSLCGFRKWPAFLSEVKREFYYRRGTMIHLATALWDRGVLDFDTVDPRITGYIEAYMKFRGEVGGKVLMREQYAESYNLGYCGTLDLVLNKSNALTPTRPLLLDIKTNEADEVTRLQTMAYRLLNYSPRAIVKRGSVALKKDGKYVVKLYDKDAEDKAAWMACLQLVGWRDRTGGKVK